MGLVYNSDPNSYRFEGYIDKDGNNLGAITKQPSKFSLQYPLTLDSTPEFGMNKVVFFINVSGNGKLSTGTGTNTSDDYRTVVRDLPESEYYKASGEKLKGLLRGLPGGNSELGKIVTAPMKRLMAAITLYVPNMLSNSYSVSWQEEDLSAGSVVDDIAGMISNPLGTSTGSSGNSQSGIGLIATTALKKTIDKLSYVQKATRVTAGNAKAEQLFKGVDFRTFSYDYDFSPRSEAEAASVLNIIRMFRHHMLPEYADKGSYMFIYPSEFEIKYFKGDKENEYLEKQMTAVLLTCNVNYTPNGQFNTFPNGMPTQIRMQLQFKELGLATKETSPYDKSGV